MNGMTTSPAGFSSGVSSIGALSAAMSSVTWAYGAAVYSKLTKDHSPATVNFCRASVALPLFALAVFLTSSQGFVYEFGLFHRSNINWLFLSIVSSYALGDALLFISTLSIGLPAAMAISSSYPIWTALGGVFFFGDHLSPVKWIGLLTVVLGTALVILSKRHVKTSQGSRLGILAALATSGLWAMNSIATARGGLGVSPFAANMVRMSFALILCPFMAPILSKKRFRPSLPRATFLLALPAFVVEGFLGSSFFIFGLTHTEIGIAAALSSLAPVLTVPIAWFTKLEKVPLSTTIGVCLVVLGIFCLVGIAS